jgi:hypothetical protein
MGKSVRLKKEDSYPKIFKTAEELKEFLVKQGKWDEFLAVRKTFVDRGLSNNRASEEARRIFEPPAPIAVIPDSSPAAEIPIFTEPPKPTITIPQDLEDKPVRFSRRMLIDVVMWVAENSGKPMPNLAKAPNVMAINWLNQCDKNPRISESFWSVVLPRLLPSKTETSDESKPTWETGFLQEALDRVERISLECKALP